MKRRKILAWIATAVTSMALVLGLEFVKLHPAQSQSTTTLNVYAAISLTNALNQIKTQFELANPSVTVTILLGLLVRYSVKYKQEHQPIFLSRLRGSRFIPRWVYKH